MFTRLYSEFRTHGTYNILFILTGAGRFNFAGTKHWLRNIDSRVLESIEFALCLESLGHGDNLYLHVSRSPKSTEIRNIYEQFRSTADLMNIPFEMIHKKINISKPLINWQHEQFSRKRIGKQSYIISAIILSLVVSFTYLHGLYCHCGFIMLLLMLFSFFCDFVFLYLCIFVCNCLICCPILVAATLSSNPTPSPGFTSASIFDTK